MRPGTKNPNNKQYFHTKIKMDKRDLLNLKKRLGKIATRNYQKTIKKKDKKI